MSGAVKRAVQVILLDIEGTLCPISFVKDVLYPYAMNALPRTLAHEWDNPEFIPYRDAFPEDHRQSPFTFTAHVQDLVQRDIKAPYLKSLQGLLWREGYASGALKAPLFADVEEALKRWHGEGRALMIYSSGSVAAQKLLFQHTGVVSEESGSAKLASVVEDPAEAAVRSSLAEAVGSLAPAVDNVPGKDITPLFSDYFDTVNAGPKTDPVSFRKILAHHSDKVPNPSNWLFLSDNTAEVEAAHKAGMQAYVVYRPGNPALPRDVGKTHRVLTTFENLELR